MRLPDPNSTDENDVPFVRHEGQAEEVLHLGTINLLGPAPLEVFQQFDSGEASGGDASLHAALLANLSLSVDESSQIVDVGPVLLGGLRRQCGVLLPQIMQTHELELLFQPLILFLHETPPSLRW